jgi:predicted MFS family arabinose efflux permease
MPLALGGLGAFVAGWITPPLVRRFGPGRMRRGLGISAMTAASLLFLASTKVSDPYLAVALISLCWNVVNPIQIGILAEVDDGGRLLALSSTVIGVGLASGPALGAAVLTGTDYSRVLWLCAGLSIVTAVLAVPALTGARKRQSTHAA